MPGVARTISNGDTAECDVMGESLCVFGDDKTLSRQEEIDLAFEALDLCREPRLGALHPSGCVACGGSQFTPGGDARTSTVRVCTLCGVVQPGSDISSLQIIDQLPRKYSNYKRVHHLHERVSQLLLNESPIPDVHFVAIARKLCEGNFTVINKDVCRAVLRSLNLQIYIEKYLSLIYRATRITPPVPGPLILQQLDSMFIDLQKPFDNYKPPTRRNFINYNFVLVRLFQEMGCQQFSMFFPLIKSKQKLKALDDMWKPMVESIGWTYKPLQVHPPFTVRLEEKDFTHLRSMVRTWEAANPSTSPCSSTEFRCDSAGSAVTPPGHRSSGTTESQIQSYEREFQVLARSGRTAQQFQRQAVTGRVPQWAKALLTQ